MPSHPTSLRLCFGLAVSVFATASLALAVNVRDFGAKGDGVADDTAALAAAVQGATDGVVEFPRGTYRITRTVEIKLGDVGALGLVGRGGSARVVMAAEGPAFRVVGSHGGTADPASVKPAVSARERMPLFDGLEIAGAHPQADGLEIGGTLQTVLRSLLIRDVRHAVHFVTRNRNVLITDCHFYHCSGIGIFLDAVNIHQMNITGSHVSYCRQGGIKIDASEIRNLQITGNDIEYNCDPNGPPVADIWIDSSQRGSVREGAITGNTIQAIPSPGGANLRFAGLAANADKIGLFSITGNHISNQTVNIDLAAVRGVSISGNTFIRGYDRHLVIEGSRNVVVSGNVFDHNADYFPSKPPAAGGVSIRRSRGVIFSHNLLDGAECGTAEAGGALTIGESREVTVDGCQITNPKFRGIFLDSSANVRVTNCLVSEEGARRMLAAVELSGVVTGSVVRGNSLGAGTGGTVVNRGEGATVDGNSVLARVPSSPSPVSP